MNQFISEFGPMDPKLTALCLVALFVATMVLFLGWFTGSIGLTRPRIPLWAVFTPLFLYGGVAYVLICQWRLNHP